ncbi:MAG: SDR family NAD(P)-dependent oxidoreductase [Alphaproteobacteria bacterium]|nr:SDR family NAD(P)-dependent oxidoreductase [Alphaproteobacteria bacterium]
MAFVTGTASCIGLGVARALVEAGMDVMLADIDAAALAAARQQLAVPGRRMETYVVDVSGRDALQRAARPRARPGGRAGNPRRARRS